jgi:hypothetical protein
VIVGLLDNREDAQLSREFANELKRTSRRARFSLISQPIGCSLEKNLVSYFSRAGLGCF